MNSTLSPQVIPARDAQAEIESILETLPELWNRHDMAGYASHFTEDVDFVTVIGTQLHGRAALQADLVAIHRTIFRNSRLELINRTIRFLNPETAVAHLVWQMTGHEMVQGKQWQSIRKGILTAVLVPNGETWRITALQNTDIVPMPVA